MVLEQKRVVSGPVSNSRVAPGIAPGFTDKGVLSEGISRETVPN